MSLQDHYNRIESLKKLKPSSEVNRAFSELVEDIIRENVCIEEFSAEQLQVLRQRCGQAEFQLEKKWSEKIINSEKPFETLKEFPYFQNYIKLSAFEYSTLVECCNDLEKTAVFVGGGPLPLTAIIFAERYGFDITVIDRDKEAVKTSQKLFEALDIDAEVKQSDAETFQNYNRFSTIHVASMVGETRDEELNVFKNIRAQIDQHTHIIGRTVHGNRKILYRPVSENVKNLFTVKAERRPSDEIINSTCIMTKN